jgi:hypothetical protein
MVIYDFFLVFLAGWVTKDNGGLKLIMDWNWFSLVYRRVGIAAIMAFRVSPMITAAASSAEMPVT